MDISIFDVYTADMQNNGLVCIDVVDDSADAYGIGCKWLEDNVFNNASGNVGFNMFIVDEAKITDAIRRSEGVVKGMYPEYFV